MEPSNGNRAPSQGQDFNRALSEAQQSGDFEFIFQTAKDSDKMLRDFKQAVLTSSFFGRDTRAIAMGLQFLDNMITQSANQLEQLKRTEKVTREAIKAAQKNRNVQVAGPENLESVPDVPAESPPKTTPELSELPAPPAEEGGWELSPGDRGATHG